MAKQKAKIQNRPLYEIGREIRKEWNNVYFGAVPYLDAMSSINKVEDEMYGQDTAESIVLYFLSNASTFRGEAAKRIKLELKAIVGIK